MKESPGNRRSATGELMLSHSQASVVVSLQP